MTDQEAFDAMCRHLLGMKKQSATRTGNCRYRAAGDLRCAVGVLIPDDQYSRALEGSAVTWIVGEVPALKGLDVVMLEKVQSIHDSHWNWDKRGLTIEAKERLRTIAADFHLSPAVLDSPHA